LTDGYGKGLEFLQEQGEKLDGSSRSRMMRLWLRDGEASRFWFLTDGDEVQVPLIHVVGRTRRDGTTYWKDVLCGKRSENDDNACRFCDDPAVDRGPWPRGCFLVYVNEYFRPVKPADKDWEVVQNTATGTKLYREPINNIWLLMGNIRTMPQIQKAYYGDPLDDDFDPSNPKTLLDRQYQLSRQGRDKNINEDLRARPIVDIPDVVREARENKPDLSETIHNVLHEEPTREDLAAWKRSGGSQSTTVGDPDVDSSSPTPGTDDEELIAF